MRIAWIGALSIGAGLLPAALGAELTSRAIFKGTPPPEVPIALDPQCSKVQPHKITTHHYVVGSEGGLANVFVWIKQGVTGTYSPPRKEALLDQRGCEFVPYMQGIQTGQKLKILNSDPLLHNVNCQPVGNKGFNLAQVVKGQSDEKVFDKPEVLIKFKCDVHPWMFAYIGVVNHPFFAVTDTAGQCTISNLPAGQYVVEALHIKFGTQTQTITVRPDEKKELRFTFEPTARK